MSNITFCDIQEGWTGEGNINVDPLFRDPENGDFQEVPTKPTQEDKDAFLIEFGEEMVVEGKGMSKQEAEQRAAEKALEIKGW